MTTFAPPQISDQEFLNRLPAPYAAVLREANGFVAFRGGFHMRGICDEPAWHSLATVWTGDHALHRLYAAVEPADIPFGEDCVGDQYMLRDGIVHHLFAEHGELQSTGLTFEQFYEQMREDPVEFLSLQPLLQFENEGGHLEPGQSISVYPPFCTEESKQGVSLEAVPMLERISFLADFARRIADLPDGTQIEMNPEKKPWWKVW